MRGTDSIATHIFEHLQLMSECCLVDSCPKRAKVVVITYSFKFTRLSIEIKSLSLHHFGRTDAKTCDMAVSKEISLIDVCMGRIERRRFRRPKFWSAHSKSHIHCIRLSCCIFQQTFRVCHFFAFGIANFGNNSQLLVSTALNCHLHEDLSLFTRNLRSCNISSPDGNMKSTGPNQTYISV